MGQRGQRAECLEYMTSFSALVADLQPQKILILLVETFLKFNFSHQFFHDFTLH